MPAAGLRVVMVRGNQMPSLDSGPPGSGAQRVGVVPAQGIFKFS